MLAASDSSNDGGVVLLRRMGAIALVVINRADANNAISNAVREGMLRVLDEVEADSNFRVVVLAGSGEEAFSVGSDVAELAALTPPEAQAMAEKAVRLHERVANFKLPVIAALKGACTGAGLELAVHCDIRFARADTRLGFPGVNIGIIPGGGTIARLSQLVGAGPAQVLLLTGGIITAERAFMLGLVTNLIEPASFRATIQEVAGHIAGLSPVAINEIKAQLGRTMRGDLKGALAETPGAFRRCFELGDTSERLRSLYGGAGPDTTVH